MKGRVLIVEDDAVALRLLSEVLTAQGHDVAEAKSAEEALELAPRFLPDVIVTDLQMEPMSGLDLLRSVRQRLPATQTIVMTAFGSLQSAVDAIREGAFDYVSKPFRMEEMSDTVRRALEAGLGPAPVAMESSDPSIKVVGRSPAMTQVFTAIARVAPLKTSVLVHGETGTGKELIARAIHEAGTRVAGPFVAVNCASLPEGLMESELFGHAKGAFTGADTERKGLFQAAEGGTIFLDEIGDMPLSVQAKLLRVLEDGEVRPVGSTQPRRVDVRIVAASHRDIGRAVEEQSFRQDLYFRLNAVVIHIPALRDRAEDLPLLVEHFLRRHTRAAGRALHGVTPAVLELFARYSWPGNVRELSHTLERAVALTKGSSIDVDDLPAHLGGAPPPPPPISQSLADVERAHILAVLHSSGGNRMRAAGILGIDRKTLYRKLRAYGLAEERDAEAR